MSRDSKQSKGERIMDSRVSKYIKTEVVKEDTQKYVLIESSDLKSVIAALNKTMAEIEKKKAISADILMDFRALQKRVEKIVKKPIMGEQKRILMAMLEDMKKV